jgi:hypothetical protein
VLLLFGYHFAQAHTNKFPEAATIGLGNPDFQEISDRFTALAEKKGAVYAFDVEKIATLPPDIDTHLLGHVIGGVLYQQKGINGIADCTPDFRNACSHAIVIGALNEFGTGSATVAMVQAACKKAPGGSGAYTMCFHGLGHGVFAYFGYDMPKALAFCKKLGTPEYGDQEFTQCVGGMIMELVDGGGHDHDQWLSAQPKYFDPNDPLAPCDRAIIPDEAKSFCYMYLTPHLFAATGADISNPDPSMFPKAFSFCTAISDKTLRDVCYSSFGKEFVPLAAAHDIRNVDQLSDAEYGEAISWCMMGGGEEQDKDCIGQAVASVFWGGENNPQASFRFCSLVSDSGVESECYKQLGLNIASYASGTERSTLCAQLPATDQNYCETANIGPQDKP